MTCLGWEWGGFNSSEAFPRDAVYCGLGVPGDKLVGKQAERGRGRGRWTITVREASPLVHIIPFQKKSELGVVTADWKGIPERVDPWPGEMSPVGGPWQGPKDGKSQQEELSPHGEGLSVTPRGHTRESCS